MRKCFKFCLQVYYLDYQTLCSDLENCLIHVVYRHLLVLPMGVEGGSHQKKREIGVCGEFIGGGDIH